MIKAIVYTVLVVNLAVYFRQDWLAAGRMLHPGWSVPEPLGAFATSLDDLAWLVLLLVYEIETAWLSARTLRGIVQRTLQAVVLLCCAVIFATLCQYTFALVASYRSESLRDVDSLCQLAGRGLYYLHAQAYTGIDTANCASLGAGGGLLRLSDGTITDTSGVAVVRLQAWLSAAESLLWLLIPLVIWLMMRVQARDVADGRAIRRATRVNACCYALIGVISCYWAWQGHGIYLWDNLVWTGGFLVIQGNLAKRRPWDPAAAGS